MAYDYAYMGKVAEVCELESYEEAVKDSNRRATMEEMRALANVICFFGNTFDMPTGYRYQGKCDVKTRTRRRR